ncbi:acetyl-CoA carboxylase biotin carboxyl carrier protein [Bythopirellula goksoeyrii]|uniref:Biotin carboxyl carrier protein of acetyl-CoA carboxylase n=1 Tax=Bythopirellula goksoeyrii TaxID=1400387 RepID=A0A5B9QGA5_9BACT|nr:acetyl-CoA carboxylase biotin carboxyl carrier protein [Bythopirellula goksoeyrii]QEG36612.1 Acetyl-CoA biotin carboxyl carrier [Bythopirellula goksoeyrii]
MSNGGSGSSDVFDVRKVRRLVELMNEHELAEVDLRQGDQRIRLRRGQEPVVTVGGASVPLAPTPAPTAVPAADSTPQAVAAEEANVAYVTSPMVGTFYVASSPESPALVSVGDSVGSDTVVCIIEAMKVFNEIPAECSGKLLARLVENGDPVEYGQKLFKVQRG